MAPESRRLRGTARAPTDVEGRRPFRRVALVSGKKTIVTIDEGEVEIDLAEGGVSSIEVPAEGLTLVGATASVHEGAWGDLRDRPEAAGLVRNVVTPFTDVELHVVSIERGDPVEVYGTVFEWAFDEVDATARTAAVRHPSRVVADILATGPQPEDAMRAMTLAIAERKQAALLETKPAGKQAPYVDPGDPRVGPPPFTLIPLGAALLPAVGCLASLAGTHDVTDAWCLKLVAVLWTALAISFRPWRDVPEFYSREKPIRKRTGLEFVLRLLFGSTPFMLWVAMWGSRGHGLAPGTLLVASIVFLIGWTASEVLWNAQAYKLLATLVDAPRPALRDASGRSGTCEGVVSDPTPAKVAGREVAVGVVTEWHKGLVDDPDKVTSAKLHARGTFLLETREGAVTIDPDDCVWATTVKDRPEKPSFNYTVSEWIPVGGRVVAFGRFLRRIGDEASDLRLSSVGTRPAIVLATTGRGDPLRLARRLVWHRRVTLMGLVVAAGAIAALAMTRPQ